MLIEKLNKVKDAYLKEGQAISELLSSEINEIKKEYQDLINFANDNQIEVIPEDIESIKPELMKKMLDSLFADIYKKLVVKYQQLASEQKRIYELLTKR